MIKPLTLLLTTTLMVILVAEPTDAVAEAKAKNKKGVAKGPDVFLNFERLDTNRNGTLSKQEFQAFNGLTNAVADDKKGKKPNNADPVPMAIRDGWFKKLDTNGDNTITLEEFSKIKEVLGIPDPPAKKDKKAK